MTTVLAGSGSRMSDRFDGASSMVTKTGPGRPSTCGQLTPQFMGLAGTVYASTCWLDQNGINGSGYRLNCETDRYHYGLSCGIDHGRILTSVTPHIYHQ